MAANTSTNPRRRSNRTGDADTASSADAMHSALLDSFSNMSIRKGDTFHPQSNTSQSDFWDPLEASSSATIIPTALRSTTSPKSLEDLLIGAGDRRVADLLQRVDRAVAINSKIALSNVLTDPDVLPLPQLTVTEPSQEDASRTPRMRSRHHSHSSDSGLGSSIADSTEIDAKLAPASRTVTHSSSSETIQSLSGMSDEERGLSKYAAEQIHKHIIVPILREESLKEFHELIQSVPERIGDKEIKTLRDLEKTLIFLAPDYSRSPSKYLRFCERTIRVLHTTVTTLHESDQRAPTDRPYTQGYFFDLVEQIRRYATILAVTREKQAKGEALDAMDVKEDEKLSLHGGMSHNGKQAELVRLTSDGKVISVATGKTLSESELASASSMKRPAELDVDDDEEAVRSMARRKKNAKPEIHTCELCQKEFKRPCDLTKHVKTHERPWKCSEIDCKYHEYGWPTEKERDRHVNDKHSDTPSLYHCLFKPCPYTSKRESNCKQHMEKAHGWTYVRSKSNGKGRASIATRLPQGSIPPSPASSLLTPLTPIAPSPSGQSWAASSRSGSMAPPSIAGSSNHVTPFVQPSPDFSNHFNMNFDFNDMANFPTSAFPITPAMSAERRPSGTLSSHSDFAHFDGSSFDDFSPNDLVFDDFSDLNNFSGNYSAFATGAPIAGPSSAVGFAEGNLHAHPASAPSSSHISPLGSTQIDQTFTFDDAMNLDGTGASYGHDFSGMSSSAIGPEQDFTLFGGSAAAVNPFGGGVSAVSPASATGTSAEMFPSLMDGSQSVHSSTASATANSPWGEFGSAFAPAPVSGSQTTPSSSASQQQQQQQQQHQNSSNVNSEEMSSLPPLLVSNSTLAELFPELEHH